MAAGLSPKGAYDKLSRRGAFYLGVLVASFAFACESAPAELEMESTGEEVTSKGDHPHDASDGSSVHGMLATGTERMLLSHLPMFHPPHDYQVLLEAEFEPGSTNGSDPMEVYRGDVETSGEPVYTIVPQPFVLPALAHASEEEPFSFAASLVRGHFERGGQSIVDEVQVVVTNVVHFRELSAEAPRPTHLTYILFGSASETFAAHYITTRPDFDHVVRVNLGTAPEQGAEQDGAPFDELELARGILVTFPEAALTSPLPLGTAEGVIPGESELTALGLASQPQPEATRVTLEVVEQVYLEHGDLSF